MAKKRKKKSAAKKRLLKSKSVKRNAARARKQFTWDRTKGIPISQARARAWKVRADKIMLGHYTADDKMAMMVALNQDYGL